MTPAGIPRTEKHEIAKNPSDTQLRITHLLRSPPGRMSVDIADYLLAAMAIRGILEANLFMNHRRQHLGY